MVCQPSIGSLAPVSVFAEVRSEVAQHLMMTFGPGASTLPRECGRTAIQSIDRGRHNYIPMRKPTWRQKLASVILRAD